MPRTSGVQVPRTAGVQGKSLNRTKQRFLAFAALRLTCDKPFFRWPPSGELCAKLGSLEHPQVFEQLQHSDCQKEECDPQNGIDLRSRARISLPATEVARDWCYTQSGRTARRDDKHKGPSWCPRSRPARLWCTAPRREPIPVAPRSAL